MPRIAVLAVVVAALLPALIALPSAQSAARRVEGRVLADDTGDPIPNAKVGFSTTAAAHATLTDGEGRFAIDTTPGIARLAVTKAGYARRDVALQPGRAVGDVRLARTGVITGYVVDANGEPVSNATVRAEARAPDRDLFLVVASSTTDDRGEYRLSGLTEGRVVVSAQSIGSQGPPVYFPGVASAADGELLDVKAGDELDRIDLTVTVADNSTFAVGGGFMFIATAGLRPLAQGEAGTTVRGRVVSSTGGAIAGATVRLTQQARRQGASTRTDREGRFAFADVVPGAFLIGASKDGFSSDGSPFGRQITVTATGADAELTLTPWGSVSGRVVDELGEPVQGASMQLLRLQFQNGRRQLVSVSTRATDDRGVFRIFGVAPGQYVLSASAGDVLTAELPGYTRTFYPGVTDAAASPFITVSAGQAQSGADVTLARQRTARVSGIVRDAQGRPGLAGSLNLIPSQSSSSLATGVGARVGDGGAFEFPNVAPGRYVIQMYRGARNRSTEGEFGALTVSVGERDIDGLTVQATVGSTITGRLSFVAAAPDAAPARSGIDIEAVPSDPDLAPIGRHATADIRPDWTFTLSGISGPRRLEVTRTPPGWMVEQIRVRGIDVTDQPVAFGTAAQSADDVEVVLTDRVTRIHGRVRGRDGRAAVGATAIVFAPTRDRWYAQSRHMRAAAVDDDGRFVVEGLPAGYYYVAAVASVPVGGADAWRDPAFLDSLVVPSTSVSVGDGGRAEVSLSVIEPR